MGCSCGGDWNTITGLCKNCGKVAPFKEAPTYEQLIKENNQLHNRIKELEKMLECQSKVEALKIDILSFYEGMEVRLKTIGWLENAH